MKYKSEHFFCSSRLLGHIPEVDEVYSCVASVDWEPECVLVTDEGKRYEHQRAYNRAFDHAFSKLRWEPRPLLSSRPRLIGDFRKNDVFIEVQFGNSATLYRDYYKFHYGLTHNLLALAILITPTDPVAFFPTRPSSIGNMASFELASRYFTMLQIPVPILLIGLLPEN